AHRLDFETSGVMLLAKTKYVLVKLADMFGSERPHKQYLALSQGTGADDRFEIDAKISPNTFKPGLMRIDSKRGKRSRTLVQVAERFTHWTLFRCQPLTGRTHQIRVHLRHAGFPIVADRLYGGRELFLSNLKRDYRLKPGKAERPLLN